MVDHSTKRGGTKVGRVPGANTCRPLVRMPTVPSSVRASLTLRWQLPDLGIILPSMDITPLPDNHAPVDPSEAEQRRRRIAQEAEEVAKARASVAAGRVVDEAEVDAWIDSIGTDHELPVPYSGR